MSSAVAVAVKKIAVYVLGDENKRGKLFVAVGSIIAGFLGLMFLPIAVILCIGSMNIEQPDIDKSLFTESALFESLDSEQQAEITDIPHLSKIHLDRHKFIFHINLTESCFLHQPFQLRWKTFAKLRPEISIINPSFFHDVNLLL